MAGGWDLRCMHPSMISAGHTTLTPIFFLGGFVGRGWRRAVRDDGVRQAIKVD